MAEQHHIDHDHGHGRRRDDDHDQDEQQEYNEQEERSGVGGSRWNPTKEQIEMLEKMYTDEGVRTPSAEQIQQITARLRVYGYIEGKNVFYWFQNHKARQRQKQRLERLSAANHNVNHLTQFLGHPPHHHYHPNHVINGLNLNSRPIFPASHPNFHHHYLPNPNVICSPYYHLPQPNNLGFYNTPHHNYTTPAPADHNQGMKKKPSKPIINKSTNKNMPLGDRGVPPGSTLSGYCAAMMNSKSMDHIHQYDHHHGNCMGMRTLNLFPVHPTGILEHKFGGNNTNNNNNNNNNNSAGNSCATSCSSSDHTNTMNDINGDHQNPQLFDFFSSSHASSESD